MNRAHRRRRYVGLTLLVVAAAALFGLSSTNGPVVPAAVLTRQVDLPSGFEYPGIVWLNSDWIVALRRPISGEKSVAGADELIRLSVAHPATSEALVASSARDCPMTNLRYPRKFDSFRIAVIRVCPAEVSGGSLNYVSLIDTSAGSVTDLTEWVPINQLTEMALSPQSVYPLIVVAAARYAYRVSDGQTVNDLGRNYLDLGYEGARAPAWSPDGSRIAYAGVINPGQISPSDADIVVANRDLTQPKVLLSGVQLPFNLQWSGTGKWLAFRGRVGGSYGVWAMKVSSRALYRVWGELCEYAWKPDSDTELVVICPLSQTAKDNDPALLFLTLPE